MTIPEKVLYLSGAPRLSTRPDTESLGPRSHILGVIEGFRANGLHVERFIVGDSAPAALHASGSEARMTKSAIRVAITDVLRYAYRVKSRLSARRMKSRDGAPSIVYERYALYQELGSVFQASGSLWVLEVNALLSIEGTSDRTSTTSRALALRAEGRTLRRADVIVAVTDVLADEIVRTHRVPRSRIVVMPNGVSTERYEARGAVASDRRAPDHILIGFLGTLYPWQNVHALLHAMADADNPRIQLRVAGAGPELAALKRTASELRLNDRVEFLGAIHPDRVPDFLAGVDVCFAGHSSSNGSYFSPLKLWEYLAAGKPVIANRSPLTMELADAGHAIEIFDESLPLALATSLSGLPSRIHTLRDKARGNQARVWLEHSWTARVARLLSEIDRIRWQTRLDPKPLRWGWGAVTPMTADEVARLVVERRNARPPFVLANLNLHGVYLGLTDQRFRSLYNAASATIIDGWPVLRALPFAHRRWKGHPYRVGSTDWLDRLLATDPSILVVAVGGSPATASSMEAYVARTCARMRWRHFDGFRPDLWSRESEEITASLREARLILVGMGMPLQEKWISDHLELIEDGVVANVGGCFDYYTGAQRLAPRWIGRVGLEWAYRLAHDPGRLARRYLREPLLLLRETIRRTGRGSG